MDQCSSQASTVYTNNTGNEIDVYLKLKSNALADQDGSFYCFFEARKDSSSRWVQVSHVQINSRQNETRGINTAVPIGCEYRLNGSRVTVVE